jgi:hypothetical protein
MNEAVPVDPRPSDFLSLKGRRLSEILVHISAYPSRDRISVGELVSILQDRAISILLVVFAAPNLVPTPPGASLVLGAPLIFLSVQLMVGAKPWLPRLIRKRSIGRVEFATIVGRIVPWLEKAERFLKPRWKGLTYPPVERLVGAVCLLLAVILFLPIPLGNILPALAICLFGLGILERDGVWILCGGVVSVAAVVLVSGVLVALVIVVTHFILALGA